MSELTTSWNQVWLVALSTVAIFTTVIVYARIVGLRSFSTMSGFDFASTVAVGSIMATVAVTTTSLANGVIGLATLFAAQVVVALLRRTTSFDRLVDNEPMLLMVGGEVLDDNLRRARMTPRDLDAKLREANVTDRSDVLAVVFETTGDVSVLQGDGPLDPALFDGVRGRDRLSS